MKKTRIFIPRGGLPAWKLPEDPDTAGHARARTVLFGCLIATYLSLVIAALLGKLDLSWSKGVFLGYSFLLGLPTIHYGIRPGKGKVWAIASGLLVLAWFVPILLVVIPFSLLGTQMWRSTRMSSKASLSVQGPAEEEGECHDLSKKD